MNRNCPPWAAHPPRLEQQQRAASIRSRLGATSPTGGLVQARNIALPLLHVGPQDATVVGIQPVDLAFNVRRLRPNAAAARIPLNLLAELPQQNGCAIVVRLEIIVELVSLIDGVDGCFHLPEAARISRQ